MERPATPQLDAVLVAVEELRAAEKAVADKKDALATVVAELASIADPTARLDAAVYAYWFAPEVNANQLGMVTTGKPSSTLMLQAAGAVSIGVGCDRCAEDVPIRSRTHMREVQRVLSEQGARYAEGYRVLCDPCREAVFEERWAANAEQHEANLAKDRELARLSYADYLRTQDWLRRRDEALVLALHVHQQALCVICEEAEGLAAVHVVFDLAAQREGIELMCQTCSAALSAAGKLAVPPHEGNRVSRIHLEALARRHIGKTSFGRELEMR